MNRPSSHSTELLSFRLGEELRLSPANLLAARFPLNLLDQIVHLSGAHSFRKSEPASWSGSAHLPSMEDPP